MACRRALRERRGRRRSAAAIASGCSKGRPSSCRGTCRSTQSLLPLEGDPLATAGYWSLPRQPAGRSYRHRRTGHDPARELEEIGLSFLDVICCGFGAIILLLMIVKIAEPVVLEEPIVNLEGIVAQKRDSLHTIQGPHPRTWCASLATRNANSPANSPASPALSRS